VQASFLWLVSPYGDVEERYLISVCVYIFFAAGKRSVLPVSAQLAGGCDRGSERQRRLRGKPEEHPWIIFLVIQIQAETAAAAEAFARVSGCHFSQFKVSTTFHCVLRAFSSVSYPKQKIDTIIL
jgi:hypothetical protein